MAQTKEQKEKKAKYMKEWREKNKNHIKNYDKDYKKNNVERVKEWKRNYYHRVEKHNITDKKRVLNRKSVNKAGLKRSANLTDSYINKRLKHDGFKKDEITQELIEVKRIILKIKRL